MGRRVWQRVSENPRDAALAAALLLNVLWGLIAFAFVVHATTADDVGWGVVIAVGLLTLLISLWLAVLVRRLAPGVERTGRKAVITLLILTIPVFFPPGAYPLFLSFGVLTLVLLAIAGRYWLAERRARIRAAG